MHAATVEEDLFPPDPKPVESTPPESDHIEGLSLRMTQAMNHYQKQEHVDVSCVGTQDTLQGIVHIVKPSMHMAKGTFKLPGARQKNRTPASKNNASN